MKCYYENCSITEHHTHDPGSSICSVCGGFFPEECVPIQVVTGRGGGHRWKGAPYSDDEGSWRCGCGAYCDHHRPCSRHGACNGSYSLRLTQYERDNLLHALYAASYTSPASPLRVLDTGDWFIQVLRKLEFRDDDQMDWGSPNVTSDQFVQRARDYGDYP